MNLATHLTDDQLDDYLLGDLAAAAQSHLDTCPNCLARVAAARAPIASFNAVTLAWAERTSVTMPISVAPQPVWGRRLAWSSAVTAALAIGIAIPTTLHQGRADAAPAQLALAATGSTGSLQGEEQISRDNQMLQDIDLALSGSSRETPAALGLAGEQSHVPNPRRSATVRD